MTQTGVYDGRPRAVAEYRDPVRRPGKAMVRVLNRVFESFANVCRNSRYDHRTCFERTLVGACKRLCAKFQLRSFGDDGGGLAIARFHTFFVSVWRDPDPPCRR